MGLSAYPWRTHPCHSPPLWSNVWIRPRCHLQSKRLRGGFHGGAQGAVCFGTTRHWAQHHGSNRFRQVWPATEPSSGPSWGRWQICQMRILWVQRSSELTRNEMEWFALSPKWGKDFLGPHGPEFHLHLQWMLMSIGWHLLHIHHLDIEFVLCMKFCQGMM